MPVKRSRNDSSSSHPVTPVATTAAASFGSEKVMKPSVADVFEFSPPKFSTVVPPVVQESVGEYDQMKIGSFLERCHYCQKRIAQNSEVFMYSNLCAFCSVECRNIQIANDQNAETRPANPKEKAIHGQGIYNIKG